MRWERCEERTNMKALAIENSEKERIKIMDDKKTGRKNDPEIY